MKKEWHSLSTNNQNKPEMTQFLKFKSQSAWKLNFNWGQFFNKYQNLVISKSGKKSFGVENLHSNTKVNLK